MGDLCLSPPLPFRGRGCPIYGVPVGSGSPLNICILKERIIPPFSIILFKKTAPLGWTREGRGLFFPPPSPLGGGGAPLSHTL